MRSFLARQQQHAAQSHTVGETQTAITEGAEDIDQAQTTSLQDVKTLTTSFSKLAQSQQLHLLEQAQLLTALDALELLVQRGEALLIGPDQQV